MERIKVRCYFKIQKELCYNLLMPQIETIFNTLKSLLKKDQDLIAEAYDFAKIAHAGQLRKW